MSKSLSGTSLVGGSVNYERVENDFYATDPQSVKDLLSIENMSKYKSFLEPCCGQGHISKMLHKYFPKAMVDSEDLVYRGYGNGNINFLTKDFGNKKYDCIITNPPYKLAKEFIEKSLRITNCSVFMFLKIQFLEGQNRKNWLKKSPLKYIYVFSKRQNPLRNGETINKNTNKKWSSTMCFAWFMWEHKYIGEPIIRWI